MSVPRRGPPGFGFDTPNAHDPVDAPDRAMDTEAGETGGGDAAPDHAILRGEHRPSLSDGRYTLSVHHEFNAGGTRRNLGPDQHDSSWRFEVAGPRFALPKAMIRSVYPPPGDASDHVGVLPHLVLSRSTLPWERSADSGEQKGPPWLTIVAAGPEDRVRVAKHPNGGDAPDVSYLSIPADRLPKNSRSLVLGAHVRMDDSGEPEAATILSPFPLSEGSWTLHLVSVEGLYQGLGRIAPDGQHIEVPSLHAWRVTVVDKGRSHFEDLVGAIHAGPFGVDAQQRLLQGGDLRLAQGGAVPMLHRLRDGSSTVSWYRGPLLGLPEIRPDVMFDLPVRSADDLVVVDTERGMLDCSYAVAWEYGRLMTLARSRVARSLARWKRQRRRSGHAHACCSGHPAADFVEPVAGVTTPFPEKAYFREDLGLLAALPFGCLVPDPEALPPESLRVFEVDHCWIHCLQDGAFLTGRATEGDYHADCKTCETLCHCGIQAGNCDCIGPPAPEKGLGGFLLRSRLVADLPDLEIEAAGRDGKLLTLRRMSSPGPGILMGIYDGWPASLRLFLPPQKMHFAGGVGEIGIDADAEIRSAAFAKSRIAKPHSKIISLIKGGPHPFDRPPRPGTRARRPRNAVHKPWRKP